VAVGRGTVVVTGGAGFVGVNLAPALADRGWRTVAVDNGSTGRLDDAVAAGYDDVVAADVRDGATMRALLGGAHAVVHLAAQTGVPASIEDPLGDHDSNVRGTLELLMATRDSGTGRFVLASSNAPLGDAPQPVHEGLAARPLSPYGASKLAAEAYCSAFAGSYRLATVALRFANVYGPFSYHKGSVVATYLKAATAGLPLDVHGDGSQTRDFVYVGDLCQGITAAVEPGAPTGLFHLGTGVETSVGALAQAVAALFEDRAVEVRHRPGRPGEVARSCSDITAARHHLGYSPSTSLAAGLAATQAWFLTHLPSQATEATP
jgi:UDP-glucose 4-epimerase